jgi:predicted ferric reductase
MFIDRTHLRWLVGTFALAGLATVARMGVPAGSIASRWFDLLLGVCGTGLMLFAALLPLRKRLPSKWPILGLQTWLKGHIWCGLLSILMVLLHAGLRRGGPLTTVLLIVLLAILLSGVTGLLFRHLLPLGSKAARDGKVAIAGRIISIGYEANMVLHVPLTATLFVLIVVHVVASLYF